MADNTKPSEDASVATKDQGGNHHQKVLAEFSVGGTPTLVASSDPLPVGDAAAEALLEAIGALLTAIEADTGPLAGLLTTIDADTGNLSTILTRLTEIEEDTDNLAAIKTAVELIDNVVAGSEIQADVVTLPGVVGNVAHGSADSGAPLKIGGRAETSMQAAEADGDRVDALFDKFGRIASIAAPLDNRVSGSIDLTDTTTTDVIAAPGASIAIVVTDIEVSNGDATVGTFVEVFDDATKKWKGFAGALGGGFSQSNSDGLFVCTANKAVRAKCVTTSSETSVNVSGYKIPA